MKKKVIAWIHEVIHSKCYGVSSDNDEQIFSILSEYYCTATLLFILLLLPVEDGMVETVLNGNRFYIYKRYLLNSKSFAVEVFCCERGC